MPQNRKNSKEDFDAINPVFPPPSRINSQPNDDKETERRKKKEKKWSFGGFFRRRKSKDSDTDTSSPTEEEKKGFLERRRSARKKRNRGSKDVTGSFEHVIVNRNSNNIINNAVEKSVVKDNSERLSARSSHESLGKKQEGGHFHGSSASLEGSGSVRRSGRMKVMARVEANRDRLRADSSSDEGGSSRSRHSVSSTQQFRSDENLGSKDGSLNRKSRSARTERYIKRLSRDEEGMKGLETDSHPKISRSDERLSNKNSDVKIASGNRWTAKVVYYESSDYETKYTAKTRSATPSPIQSPKARPKNIVHQTTSAPPGNIYTTFPPSHREGVIGSHQELRSHSFQGGAFQRVTLKSASMQKVNEGNMLPKIPKSKSDASHRPLLQNSFQKQSAQNLEQKLPSTKSASFDSNINMVNQPFTRSHPSDSNILVVQFPISRPNQKKELVDYNFQARSNGKPNPPPPPPRDPQRRIINSNGFQQDSNQRPMSYAFENKSQPQNPKSNHIEYNTNNQLPYNAKSNHPLPISKHHRSNSDQQLPSYLNYLPKQSPPMQRRLTQLYSETIPSSGNKSDLFESNPTQAKVPQHYQYYTDQQPRSRKPIHIAYHTAQNNDQPYLSDSQVIIKPPFQQVARLRPTGVQNASEFWKQKEQETTRKMHLSSNSPKVIQKHLQSTGSFISGKTGSNNPRHENSFTASKLNLPPIIMPIRRDESTSSLSGQSDISSPRIGHQFKICHNEIGIPLVDSNGHIENNSKIESKDLRPLSMVLEKSESSEHETAFKREKSIPPLPPVRKYSKQNSLPTDCGILDDVSDNFQDKRKSSNLEEALNELEAIYKTLRLGEENLLEKTERIGHLANSDRLDPTNWNAWVQSRGFESDSSFNYSRSSIDSIDSPLHRNINEIYKPCEPDRLSDDMAYRRLNKKDRPTSQEQDVISQAGSFLLVSPTLSPPPFAEAPPISLDKDEPDVTLDDVVYRNIKHVNNTLKVLDPQPPFGIPLGPISPAPNSDYLHITPKEKYKPTFKPRKTPDIVTDDLAFRNLRKDSSKDTSLFNPEDSTLLDVPNLKKKRAIRSLSANLLGIIQKESYSMSLNNNNSTIKNNNVRNDFDKSQSITDLPDTMVSLRLHDNKENLVNSNIKQNSNLRRRNLSEDESDCIIRSRKPQFVDGYSLGMSTSTETLTDSRANLQSHESKTRYQKYNWLSMDINHFPPTGNSRMSITPERNEIKNNSVRDTLSSQPIINHAHLSHLPSPLTSITPEIKQDEEKSDIRQYSPSRVKEGNIIKHSPSTEVISLGDINFRSVNQTESDLLAILAKEARATSEQLGRELKELNEEKPSKLNKHENKGAKYIGSDQINKSSHSIGKVVHHKPVKLNTFLITEDKKSEDKKMPSSNEIVPTETSKSMTDLLKELTRSLDNDFGTENEKEEHMTVSVEDYDHKIKSQNCDNIEQIQMKNAEDLSEDSNSESINTICQSASSLSALSNSPLRGLSPTRRSKENISVKNVTSSEKSALIETETNAFHAESAVTDCKILPNISLQKLSNIRLRDNVVSTTFEIPVIQNNKDEDDAVDNALEILVNENKYYPENNNRESKSEEKTQLVEKASHQLESNLEESDAKSTNQMNISETIVSSEDVQNDIEAIPSTTNKTQEPSEQGVASNHRPLDCSAFADEEACKGKCEEVLSSAMVVKVQATDMNERRSTEAADASALNRQQRIARYKEERRRQLASQFGRCEESSASTSSSGGGVIIRTTRTSRLRASTASDGQKTTGSGRLDAARREAAGGNRLQVTTPANSDSKEKSPVSDVSSSTGPKRERDKSSKRKSNLNRSLNAEEVPALESTDENGVRRRRRIAVTPTLSSLTPSPANVRTPSTRSTPSPRTSVTSPRPVTASRQPSSRSDRGSTPESDTPKSRIPRKISSSSSNVKEPNYKSRPSSTNSVNQLQNGNSPESVTSPTDSLPVNHLTNGTSDTVYSNGNCSMELSLTESVIVKPFWNGNGEESVLPSPDSLYDLDSPELVAGLPIHNRPSSILKKKSVEEPSPILPPSVQHTSTKPVSILKRKTSQEEGPNTVVSQPVTFSPSVIDPVSSRRQGILKKHRSLDESEVIRRRSCSPDIDAAEFKPILKNQRRSSLEELVRRAQSPEPQSILKRKSSREENFEHSSGSEPQGILKRKSSSASSSGSVHVTIAESVILAVSGAKESVYDEDHVRPILKKKNSSSEEPSLDSLSSCSETPKPILKKKSSSETDDTEEKHRKRPILKSRKDSGSSNCISVSQGLTYQSSLDTSVVQDDNINIVTETFTECEADALAVLDRSSPPRDISSPTDKFANITFRKSRSPFDSECSSNRRSFDADRMRIRDLDSGTPRRPLSVAERVMNMEHFLALEATDVHQTFELTSLTGAVPKRPRDRERCRTQPITFQELSSTQSWQRYPENSKESSKSDESSPVNKDKEEHLEMSEVVGVRLSRSDSVSAKASLFAQLEKKAADEVKPKRFLKGSTSRRALDTSRFNTHPVTSDEVEEARRQNENKNNIENQEQEDEDQNDPSKLSLAERVSLFNKKMVTERLAPPRSRSNSRFKTQPVTTEEVVTAQKMVPISHAASGILVAGILKNLAEKTGAPGPKKDTTDSSAEESEESEILSQKTKRGILKTHSFCLPRTESVKKEPDNLRSVLKKENDKEKKELSSSSTEIHSILKVSKSKETCSEDSSASQSENSESDMDDEAPNKNSDLVSLLHKVEAQARSSQKFNDDNFKNVTIRKKPNLSLNINNKKTEDSDKVMNLKNLDQGKENRRIRKKESSDTSEGDTSSSGGREVRRIIGNEAVARRRQAALAKQAAERSKISGQAQPLSKSRSQSAVQDKNARSMNGEVAIRCSGVEAAGPLRRCLTQPMGPHDDVDESLSNGASIAQRLAALQKSGQSDWRKRISRLNPEEDLPTPKNISDAAEVLRQQLAAAPQVQQEETPASAALSERLGRLETASQGWKKRIAPSDAVQFSVAGRMALSPSPAPVSPLHSPAAERKKRAPKPNRFRSREGNSRKEVQSMPTSPEPDIPPAPSGFKRSISAPGGDDDSSLSPVEGDDVFGPMVSVPDTFDEEFTSFFSSATNLNTCIEQFEIRDEDLDDLKIETNQLLIQKKTVRVQHRRGASSNPIKALAARSDLRTEYVEVKSGVAQRELKRINIEKLSKNSTLAIEALAGLASKEDFTAINLRKAAESTVHLSPMLPYNELMLLQIKGRRHVQTRLVQPHYTSIDQGDSYVLVTPSEVYFWIGEFSNIIERSRGAEIAQNIIQSRDLGSTASQVITLLGVQKSANHAKFWKLLGAVDSLASNFTGREAGHPDEDELYESAVIDTNMVYELEGDELIPSSQSWGTIPKIEILDPSKVLVFDFGSELYIWMGKNVSLDRRRMALKLGQELWQTGYDYSECDISPLNQALFLGNKNCDGSEEKKASTRPEWALLAKVTQHMETVLFREKFLDWPDFSRVIRTKGADDKEKQVDSSLEIKPCDAQEMVDWTPSEADLELEGSHLGRGRKYYDSETHRHYEITTLGVRMWHVQEFESSELDEEHLGQFHTDDSYVIRWLYSITVTGRELNGQPSRHSMIGRDRCAYFIWQGTGATVNDQGAAALLTVELDKERGPQIRVAQGSEPPAFKQLFNGGMSIHKGKLGSRNRHRSAWRLYLCRGEVPEEALLVEVTCSMRQLRSRSSFILLNTKTGHLFIWHGAKSLPHTRKVALMAAENLQEKFPIEAGLDEVDELIVEEVSEGKEPKQFFEGLGGSNRGLYVSLANTPGTLDWTPRLYHLSSVLGVFKSTPVISACSSSEITSPFPFLQQDLYSARQPALFLFDADKEIWLWQGWWGEESRRVGGGEEEENGGWGEVRWQAERRAAMSTALEYWKLRHGSNVMPKAHLVWAGLEPLEFTNLFPEWTDRDDIAEINIKDGRKPGEVLSVQSELARLTRSTYPPAQLLQRPLPDGVDPTRLENYLAPHHFKEMLGMSKEEFAELPTWKQAKLKKVVGLF